jgi:hypothetical protein
MGRVVCGRRVAAVTKRQGSACMSVLHRGPDQSCGGKRGTLSALAACCQNGGLAG